MRRNPRSAGEGILYFPGSTRQGLVAGLWKRYAFSSQRVIDILRFYPPGENGWGRI